ncbi:DNA-binding response regulator [Chryseobacterium sp. T16E-39]|uniref:response regulator transcription factor n=1 Tax=Chryseobacterium sp. T16E-39 TaxID=2015076 RepID=UPI000B5B48C9|nr:response regulator transcription factor [Chryseobacterium sp. T16E-39]ASK29795.1 DNA-binding response regulator [Chryseobacterium sp. T16E-39]
MSNKIKLLYLEDDALLGEVTTDMLTRDGFAVKWVTNGVEGLEITNDESFDIVVADIMMPKLDGYTFLKTLRDSGNDIPIILLSARVLTEDVLKGFEIGADDYIRKPFSIEELIARIHRILRNSSTASSGLNEKNTISIGEYEYSPHSYKLKHKEESFNLSPRAGEILYLLATSKDNLLPRKETLINLWGDDNFFNGRSLDVFISKLRKQLSRDPRISIINIRATGYRLVIS